jgi:hypothetical protein
LLSGFLHRVIHRFGGYRLWSLEQRLWGEASAYPILPGVRLTKPTALPWFAVGLLPDGMALLGEPDLMFELGDFERCVAWALLEGLPRVSPAA